MSVIIQELQASPNLEDNLVSQEKALWHDNFSFKDANYSSSIPSGIPTNMFGYAMTFLLPQFPYL